MYKNCLNKHFIFKTYEIGRVYVIYYFEPEQPSCRGKYILKNICFIASLPNVSIKIIFKSMTFKRNQWPYNIFCIFWMCSRIIVESFTIIHTILLKMFDN